MLKKIFHTVLSLLLLLATTGMAISKHYCSGELSKIEVGAQEVQCCDNPDDMPEGCCHDEQLTFSLVQSDFQPSYFDLNFSLLANAIILSTLDYTALFAGQQDYIPPFNSYIPPPLVRELSIVLQSFII